MTLLRSPRIGYDSFGIIRSPVIVSPDLRTKRECSNLSPKIRYQRIFY